MSISGRSLVLPLSISEVASLLGESSQDLATLCSSGKINRWAKYKPVRVDSVAAITEAQRTAVNQGMDLDTSTNSTVFVTWSQVYNQLVNNVAVSWGYNKIRPGTDWSRLTDFINYYHDALPPLRLGSSSVIWDSGTTSLENFVINSYFKLSNGYSFGDVSGVQISLDEFNIGTGSGVGFKNYYLALLYFSSSASYICANSEYPMNGNVSAPPVIYPGRWTAFANVLNQMAVGSSIRCVPVINPITSLDSQRQNGGLAARVYRYPAGDILTITKTNTPSVSLVSRGIVKVFYYNAAGVSSSLDAYRYINSLQLTSAAAQNIARQANYAHHFCMVATIKNNLNQSISLSAGNFFLIFCSVNASFSGNRITIGTNQYPMVQCDSLVLNPNTSTNIFKIGDALLSSITIAAGGSVSLGFVAQMSWANMNALFPYISNTGSVVKSMPILLRSGDNTLYLNNDTTIGNYSYYYKIPS